jgi:hypothetical protein
MRVQSDTGTAVVTAHGKLTLDDMKRAAKAVWGEAGFGRRRILVDLRRARFTLLLGEIEELATFTRVGSTLEAPARLAFVADGQSESGQLQMYDTFRNQPGVEIEVFGDRGAAVAWLSAEPSGE